MTTQDFVFGLDVVYKADHAIVVGKLIGYLQTLEGHRQFAIQAPGGIYMGDIERVNPLCLNQEKQGT